jgi:hypothetical protein
MPPRLISQQTLLEHEIVARLSEALRTAVAWNQHGDMSRKLSSVHFLAESFARHVQRMFELEEHSGYIEHVEQSHPELASQVTVFRGEHAAFLERLAEFIRLLQISATMSAEATDLLFDDMQTLLADIDSHNKREMNLLEVVILEQHHTDSE